MVLYIYSINLFMPSYSVVYFWTCGSFLASLLLHVQRKQSIGLLWDIANRLFYLYAIFIQTIFISNLLREIILCTQTMIVGQTSTLYVHFWAIHYQTMIIRSSLSVRIGSL